MMVELTPGWAFNHASATVEESVWRSAATLATASMMSYCFSVKSPRNEPRRPCIFTPLPRVYLPDSAPLFSGDHGNTPRPNSPAMGTSSPSTVRCISEYSICSAISGAQPRKCAMVWAWATFHAGVSEKPT